MSGVREVEGGGEPQYRDKPDDGWFYDQCAEHLHILPASFRRMCGDRRTAPGTSARPPLPDDYEISKSGMVRPWWFSERIKKWHADRPGKGVGGGAGRHRRNS